MEKVELMGGRLQLYKRPNSRFWQCYTYLSGRAWRESTKQENPNLAKEFAEDWYLTLKGKDRTGELKTGKTFRFVSEQFLKEYRILAAGERSPKWVEHVEQTIARHLIPYFGDMVISAITPGIVQEYRIHRAQNGYRGIPPARNTIEMEMIALRQTLKTAVRHRWLDFVPDFSPPFRASRKVSHRAWFSLQEYRQLYEATRERAANPKKEMWRWECEQLHDLILFLANTGLRPDEVRRLEHRDVQIVRDEDTDETILEIEVRGKTGVGFCKSMAGAVRPYIRVRKRNKPKPTDRVFPKTHRQLFKDILTELGLRRDRDGRLRTLYSLRHSYICFRLMERADVYQIAKNCRTSVEMIQKHYAAHIKNTLDAAAINTRRPMAKERSAIRSSERKEKLVGETTS
jgi:integrase